MRPSLILAIALACTAGLASAQSVAPQNRPLTAIERQQQDAKIAALVQQLRGVQQAQRLTDVQFRGYLTVLAGGQRNLPLEELLPLAEAGLKKLSEIADQAAALARADDPAIAALGRRAKAATDAGRLDEAATLFAEAARNDRAAYEIEKVQFETRARARLTRSAENAAAAGDALNALARFRDASARYDEAANAVRPLNDMALEWKYRQWSALALCDQGERYGDNPALTAAIAAYRTQVLLLAPRAARPDDWAATQNNLGIALWTLGERESGTARLDEAVAAYREALKEYTRDRAPLQWAATQNNLGIALWTLGERESGTARLDEAVAAYREALKEWTRDRVPHDWAMTQNNLGNALWNLGARESGTARLDEAVAAYREALKEWTRDRAPLDWAATQNNLGIALRTLGEREPGTARLDEAVAAYREALKERTRDRAPLQWAATQNNLGAALRTLGARESGTARLDEAVAAYREALKEWTRDRVPLDWAGTQFNLAFVHESLGDKGIAAAQNYREAIRLIDEALPVFREASPYNLDKALRLRARINAKLNAL